jgi:hypothetical protein
MASAPRVRCIGCAFAWFGPTAAHGLRIVGCCPRCGAELEFLVDAESDRAAIERQDRELEGPPPSSVLGTPLSWDR